MMMVLYSDRGEQHALEVVESYLFTIEQSESIIRGLAGQIDEAKQRSHPQ